MEPVEPSARAGPAGPRWAERATRVVERAIALGFLGGLAVMAWRLARTHLVLITFPYQLEYREGAVPLFTDLLLAGGNPYDLENQPRYTNVYGPLYNLVVYPVARLFGPTLEVHRAVAAVFILAACALVFRVVRRRGGTWPSALAAAVLLYATLLCRAIPLARPDGLGEFLFLAGLFVPWWTGFSARGLAAGAACGVLAFLTKPYFVLVLPLTAAYLFLFVSKRRGVAYAAGAAAVLAAAVLLADAVWETYLYDTFAIHVAERSYVAWRVAAQLMTLGQWNLELLALGLALAAAAAVRRLRRGRDGRPAAAARRRIDLTRWDAPLLGMRMDLTPFCLLGTLAVFAYPLGGHTGAWMDYALELVAPFLLVLAGSWIGRAGAAGGRLRPVTAALAAVLALSCLYRYAYVRAPESPTRGLKDWRAVERFIAGYQQVNNVPAIVSILVAQGKPVYHTGQSRYFLSGAAALPKGTGGLPARARARARAYGREIDLRQRNGEFDLLVLNHERDRPPAQRARELGDRYRFRALWMARMPHMGQRMTLEFWTRTDEGPRPAP